MPKKGTTQPFKAIYQYPEQPARTIACGSFDDADREAAATARRGATSRAVFRRETGEDVLLSSYGPDVDHNITTVPTGDERGTKWRCSCGRTEFPTRIRYGLVEHLLQRVGMEPVVWLLVRGESPGTRAVEPGPHSLDIPDRVLEWAARDGLSSADPDVYLMVAPADEADPAGEVVGEISRHSDAMDAAGVATIRAQFAEDDIQALPEWMR